MNGWIVLLLVVAALASLDVLALTLGQDSRDGDDWRVHGR